jgi:hypothetical protein
MATTMTLAQLLTAVRQRADLENASGIYTESFVNDDELTSYINQSYFELYDLLIGAYGEDYYMASPYSFTTDGTNELYDLPADFYKLLGCDLLTNGGGSNYTTMKKFNMGERNNFKLPDGGKTIKLWYAPTMTQLVNAGDTVNGISGWTEYIIVDCCIKCLVKEETDVKEFMMQKQALLQRIEGISQNRDAGMPSTVTDVYSIPYTQAIGESMRYRINGDQIWIKQPLYLGGVYA